MKLSRGNFIKKLTATTLAATTSAKLYSHVTTDTTPSSKSVLNTMVNSDQKKFVPVMITPYLQNGKIDYDGLSRLIDFYITAGVKGFFANCLSSEMYHLDDTERLALTTHVVKRVAGAFPVVATGSFGNTLDEQVTFAKKIYDTGINAVILISSHYAKKEDSDDVLLDNLGKMLDRTPGIPMGLYECPSPYKRILTPRVFGALLDTRRMVYHKDTSIDQEKVSEKLALVKDNPLEFYDAHTANTVFSLTRGARGMSAISGNFYPEMLVWMCNNVNDPSKQQDVQWLQEELTRTEDIISKSYPVSSKYFLKKRGVDIQPVSRSSKEVLTSQQKETLDNVYKTFLEWCERLGIQKA